MKITITKTFILFFFLAFFLPISSFAAEMFFDSSKNIFTPEEEFLVQVFIDTKDTTINAVGGEVIFPDASLELKEIRDGNSSINFWVEKPSLKEEGKITFSGITAGGFSGNKRFLFGMVFKSKKIGTSSISFSNLQVLLNDGIGTKVGTDSKSFDFIISSEGDGSSQENLLILDTESPESFAPFIAKDPTIFDGKYFVVFSAIDKGVGIHHYEVREGLWGEYVAADSPYLLENQSLTSDIYVKAIDKASNYRVERIRAKNLSSRLEIALIIGIILVICILFMKRKWPKSTPF